jgi:acyl carrier protein
LNQDEIYRVLTGVFRDLFDDENIVLSPTMDADDIADWDSLAHINLIVAIESRFRIKFKTSEVEGMHNVGHLVEAIVRKQAAQ